MVFVFFFKQKTAYEMRISDWSSDVCSSDLSTALRFAERSIVTIVTGPSVATMTLIGLAPLLGSVPRRGGTCKRRARFLNRIHAGRAPLAPGGPLAPRAVGPHRVTPNPAALSPPCFEGAPTALTRCISECDDLFYGFQC